MNRVITHTVQRWRREPHKAWADTTETAEVNLCEACERKWNFCGLFDYISRGGRAFIAGRDTCDNPYHDPDDVTVNPEGMRRGGI